MSNRDSRYEVLALTNTEKTYMLAKSFGDLNPKVCLAEQFKITKEHLLFLSFLESKTQKIFSWSTDLASLLSVIPDFDFTSNLVISTTVTTPDAFSYLDYYDSIKQSLYPNPIKEKLYLLYKPRNLDSRLFAVASLITGVDMLHALQDNLPAFKGRELPCVYFPTLLISDSTASSSISWQLLLFMRFSCNRPKPRLVQLLPPIVSEREGVFYSFKRLYFRLHLISDLLLDDVSHESHAILKSDWLDDVDAGLMINEDAKQDDIPVDMNPENHIRRVLLTGPSTAKSLSKKVNQTKSTCNQILYSLEKRGLVQRDDSTPPIWRTSDQFNAATIWAQVVD